MPEHFVVIRLAYVTRTDGQSIWRTPWKRVGRCACGWTCFSWDALRPIEYAHEHVRNARQFQAIVDNIGAAQ